MFSYAVRVIFMQNYLLLSSLGVMHSSPSPLSHHSVSPPQPPSPPSLPPLLEDLPSHSLTFSLRLIPLTMHVPKTDLIFINGANPAPPPQTPRPWTITLMHCLLSKSKSCSCSSPPSHLPIAPPRDTPVAPPPQRHTHRLTPHPSISSHIGIWRRVPAGCPPIRGSLLV